MNDHMQQLLGELKQDFDVLILAGDLTDHGLPEEAEVLAEQLKSFSMPIIGILGNHDHEGGQADAIVEILNSAGITMLQGTSCQVDSVGFVGTKGFCGGFGDLQIAPFGEAALKTFIRTTIDEAVVLENALASLQDCEHTIAILHYAPVRETLIGEPPELFPFLGASRLATAIDTRGVDVIVHGHAHHGSPYGETPGKIPVYNVCRFVQMAHTGKPYCVLEL